MSVTCGEDANFLSLSLSLSLSHSLFFSFSLSLSLSHVVQETQVARKLEKKESGNELGVEF